MITKYVVSKKGLDVDFIPLSIFLKTPLDIQEEVVFMSERQYEEMKKQSRKGIIVSVNELEGVFNVWLTDGRNDPLDENRYPC